MAAVRLHIGFVCILLLLIASSQRTFNMDEIGTCGQKIPVYQSPVTINARSITSPANPPLRCTVYLEASSRDDAYRLQIVVKSVAIKDTAFNLRIYDGNEGESLLRQLGSSSQSTDMIVTKSSRATLVLHRPMSTYQHENDFTLEIKGYRDPDERELIIGGSRLTVGAIIGIIIALLLLIVFSFVLCYMYNTGILTGKARRGSYVSGSRESLSKPPSSIASSNISNHTIATKEKLPTPGSVNNAFNSAVWSSVTANVGKPTTNARHVQSPNFARGHHGRSGSSSSNNRSPRAARDFNYDDTEYLEPLNNRRSGRPNSVTFDTRQQEPSRFQRSFASSQQSNQRSPRSSLAKSKLPVVPDRDSGHSITSYAEIKDLPDLLAKSKENDQQKQSSRERQTDTGQGSDRNKDKTSQSPRSSLQSSSQTTTATSEENNRDSSRSRNQQAESNRNPELLSSNSGKEIESKIEPSYATVNKNKQKSGNEGNSQSLSESSNYKQCKIDDDDIRNTKTVEDAVVTLSSNKKVPRKSSSQQQQPEEEEDAEDIEVKKIHSQAEYQTSHDDVSSLGNSVDFETEDEEPQRITNPLVNNFYIKKSMNDPTKMNDDTRKKYDKRKHRKVPAVNGEYNSDSTGRSHYGIPDLIQNHSQDVGPDPGMDFPSAFSAIMARTVQPDSNKTYAYGYHSHTDPEGNDSGNKAAWYVESTPTQSGPVKTTAIFMQTSNRNDSPSTFSTTNENGFGPEYTSTPADPSHGDRNKLAKPKPKARGSNNPNDRFPLSIPTPHDNISSIEPRGKSTIVKSGFDPKTGCQTSQVMWTDNIADPTDPVPGTANPCITRKTVNRITTRSTYDHLPEDPFPLLNQMQVESSQPSFLSPSSSRQNSIAYGDHSLDIPQAEDITFFNGSSAPIIHEAPNRSHYVKDSISIV